MLQAMDFSDNDDKPQLAHYIAGVGTRREDEKFIGGAFGFGISENIKNAYAFIVSNYEEGDEIYLFGFSRGAYTARSIAGLIHNLGVLYRYNLPRVAIAYKYYKDKSEAWKPGGSEADKFRQEYCHAYPTKIRFLGVWDTVGALGAPYGELLGRILDALFKTGFHDVTLSRSVDAAYHAMAADERLWPFRPTPVSLMEYHRTRNEQNIITLQGDGTSVIVKQIAGLIARRIVCRIRPGDRVSKGERIGLIKFGSRADVLFGPEWEILVQPGARVAAGSSIIARRLDIDGASEAHAH